MLKVELHAHTADDPEGFVPHTVESLVDRVAELGYDAVAITLHNRQLVYLLATVLPSSILQTLGVGRTG